MCKINLITAAALAANVVQMKYFQFKYSLWVYQVHSLLCSIPLYDLNPIYHRTCGSVDDKMSEL